MFENNTRESAQDHLDPAQLIDAATRPIDVLHTDTDTLNVAREFSELYSELSANIRLAVLTEIEAGNADMSWDQRGFGAAGYPFDGFG